MADVFITGPAGRLEGRYQQGREPTSPIAIVLHPHPQYGGTMNNKVVYTLFHTFVNAGFSVLRFNFRGVGRSQGVFSRGEGELSDAAAALDWLQTFTPNARGCWIAGFSFGAWISMQLLMRRPEISGFIAVAPPANLFDFTFLAPCPASGLIVHGGSDDLVPEEAVEKLVDKLKHQREIVIDSRTVDEANHFFQGQTEALARIVAEYLQQRLEPAAAPGPKKKAAVSR
jgi:alpha/beta superfamily hydrolase